MEIKGNDQADSAGGRACCPPFFQAPEERRKMEQWVCWKKAADIASHGQMVLGVINWSACSPCMQRMAVGGWYVALLFVCWDSPCLVGERAKGCFACLRFGHLPCCTPIFFSQRNQRNCMKVRVRTGLSFLFFFFARVVVCPSYHRVAHRV